jgi:hypothetical protein
VWAATIPLRLGQYRVGIRVDTDRTRTQLTTLLASFVDTSPGPTLSNFSIRRPDGRIRRTPGTLHLGGIQVAESTSFDVLVHHLLDHLASVAAEIPAGAVRTTLRAFEHAGSAVLVAADRSVRWKLPPGTQEIACWEPIIRPSSRTLVLPAPLEPVDWRAAKTTPPDPRPQRELSIAGIVTDVPVGGPLPDDPETVPAPAADPVATLTRLWADATGDVEGWGVALVQLHESGRIRHACEGGPLVAALVD